VPAGERGSGAAIPPSANPRSLARPRPRTSRRSPRSSRNERGSGADPCPRRGASRRRAGRRRDPFISGSGGRVGAQNRRGPSARVLLRAQPGSPSAAPAPPQSTTVRGLLPRRHHRPPTHRSVRRTTVSRHPRTAEDRHDSLKTPGEPASLTSTVAHGTATPREAPPCPAAPSPRRPPAASTCSPTLQSPFRPHLHPTIAGQEPDRQAP